MKKYFPIFILCAVISLSACTSNSATSGSGQHNSQVTERPAESVIPPQSPSPTHTELPTTPALPLTDELWAEIERENTIRLKLDRAEKIYDEYDEYSLPVIEKLMLSTEFSTIDPEDAHIDNFVKLLLVLNDSGRTLVFQDTLEQLLGNLPIEHFSLNNLLENAETYLFTAKLVLSTGQFHDDVDVDHYFRKTLYQGFSVYVAQYENLDEQLAAVKTLAEQIFPLLPDEAGTDRNWPYKFLAASVGDGDLWDAKRSFVEYMPELSKDTVVPPEAIKCLIVFRNDCDGDITDWHLDLSYMPNLPYANIPVEMSEVNTLITVDTHWEYESNYSNVTKGYKAVSGVSVYDKDSGALIKKLGEIVTRTPTTFFYSGNPPEKYYVSIDDSLVARDIMALVNEYLER